MTKSATNIQRADMPVIDKDKVAKLVSDLKSGNLDVMQPYSKEVLALIGGQKNVSGQQPQAQPVAQQRQVQPGVRVNQVPQQANNQRPQPQNLQAAHANYEGTRLDEWLVLSGIRKGDL
jgi:hypothetical protein